MVYRSPPVGAHTTLATTQGGTPTPQGTRPRLTAHQQPQLEDEDEEDMIGEGGPAILEQGTPSWAWSKKWATKDLSDVQ